MIVGICGLIGSGKDTIADHLVQDHNFVKISFADKLKDTVATLFDWDRTLLDGKTEQSRLWREQEDPYWSKELKKKGRCSFGSASALPGTSRRRVCAGCLFEHAHTAEHPI